MTNIELSNNEIKRNHFGLKNNHQTHQMSLQEMFDEIVALIKGLFRITTKMDPSFIEGLIL